MNERVFLKYKYCRRAGHWLKHARPCGYLLEMIGAGLSQRGHSSYVPNTSTLGYRGSVAVCRIRISIDKRGSRMSWYCARMPVLRLMDLCGCKKSVIFIRAAGSIFETKGSRPERRVVRHPSDCFRPRFDKCVSTAEWTTDQDGSFPG